MFKFKARNASYSIDYYTLHSDNIVTRPIKVSNVNIDAIIIEYAVIAKL